MPSRWREQVAEAPLDLLFVESAWHGNGDAWQYALTGTSAPRPALVELVAWCRENGMPTVFWNKEDPVHYADFLDTAKLFDHVCTTDSERHRRLPARPRPRPRRRAGVRGAAGDPQPGAARARGASRATSRSPACTSPHKTPSAARRWTCCWAAAEVSSRMPVGLEIFSRYLGGDENYQFPEPLGRASSGRSTTRRC